MKTNFIIEYEYNHFSMILSQHWHNKADFFSQKVAFKNK